MSSSGWRHDYHVRGGGGGELPWVSELRSPHSPSADQRLEFTKRCKTSKMPLLRRILANVFVEKKRNPAIRLLAANWVKIVLGHYFLAKQTLFLLLLLLKQDGMCGKRGEELPKSSLSLCHSIGRGWNCLFASGKRGGGGGRLPWGGKRGKNVGRSSSKHEPGLLFLSLGPIQAIKVETSLSWMEIFTFFFSHTVVS